MFASGKTAAVSSAPVYIEDVFSPYLYDGNYTARTITNNIDLLNKGGLVWSKSRDTGGGSHFLTDTARGAGYYLLTNATNGQAYSAATVGGFSTTGYTLGLDANINWYQKYISWTFRKQPKFFDIVTYTGNGAASRNISHSLGSKPGFVVIKRTDSTSDWWVAAWTGTTFRIGTDALPFALNSTNAYNTQNGAAATSTTFDPNEVTLSSNYGVTPSSANTNGATYVAYLFAHDAGGFGLTGNDNVISCGSFTTDASGNATVDIGYEPQFLMTKRTSSAGNWRMLDVMRGWSRTSQSVLYPNLANVEGASTQTTDYPYATGFSVKEQNSVDTYIYIAIRRGPMKVPTDATSVFSPTVSAATTGTKVTTNFPIDTQIVEYRTSPAGVVLDRLRGVSTNTTASGQYLKTTTTDAETTVATASLGWDNTGFQINSGWSGANTVYYNFRRAPGFFDQVYYTGNGTSNAAIAHNLRVIPELWIVKARNEGTRNWQVYYGLGSSSYSRLILNSTALPDTGLGYNAGTNLYARPTATNLYLDSAFPNTTAETYVAYLFATCPGVSKVGTYTGTGSPQTIDCGFTAGARFVMLRCTSLNGTNWVLFDSVRGIVSGIDPFIYLNSTTGEQSTLDLVAPQSTGFGFGSESYYGEINQSGQNYIFLAIA